MVYKFIFPINLFSNPDTNEVKLLSMATSRPKSVAPGTNAQDKTADVCEMVVGLFSDGAMHLVTWFPIKAEEVRKLAEAPVPLKVKIA